MKKLMATFLGIVLIAAGVSGLANPPALTAQAPVPVPPVAVQKEGPFRLLAAAKVRARHRRMEGFHADVTGENGAWWVVFYP